MTGATAFILARLADDEAAALAAIAIDDPQPDRYGIYDPARVLAQVAALRAVVEWDAEQYVGYGVVEKLAAIYADHPDFDPAWLAS